MALEREIETYRRKLPELLANKGKFVVIHGEDVMGIFDNMDDALRVGYESFLNEPFLMREIREQEQVLYTSRGLRPCQSSTDR
jgi:hypothetical protein